MGILEATILHHLCIVFIVLWILSLYNLSHPIAYLLSLIYMYLVHERYALRLGRRMRFEERRSCNQRRVLVESESVRWLNYAVEKMWLVCMEGIVSQKILLPIIPWFLAKYKPWTVKDAVVRHLYMGRSPPMFTEMRVLRQCRGDDHLVLELGMNFKSADDMSAILSVRLKKRLGFGMKSKLHLMGLHVEGKVLVGVKFLRHWPFLGRLRVCFAEPPYFQMTVKPMFTHGLDVAELPGIAGWLDKLLALAFEQTLVEPNMLVVDMEKFVSPQPETWFFVDEKEPVAYALVEVIEAIDMKPSDPNGLADPYVKGQLGQYRFRTKIQKKTLSPKWHEEFKIPICTWESPNLLAIEVRDKDRFVDDTLGDCVVNVADFRSGQRHDMWLPLENIKMGRLHLAITVVEDNGKDQDQPGNVELVSDNDDYRKDNSLSKSSQEHSRPLKKPEESPKVADKFEAIGGEGQEETGIWVHQPGNEVSQIWEQRKGRNRLADAKIICQGADSVHRSSASGINNENSSTEGSEEGKKNKVISGLKKIGFAFQRKKEHEKEEVFPSPRPNIKAVNERKIGMNFVVEKPDISSPGVDGSKRDCSENLNKRHVKEKAKSILRHAGYGVKHVFTRNGSKNSENGTETASQSGGSRCSDDDTNSPSVCSPISVSGDLKSGELNNEKNQELVMNYEDLTNMVNVVSNNSELRAD